MTDKEFKRLNRAQLIEIIYQLQLKIDDLTERNIELENALSDKRLHISNAGNLAEAVLKINDCFTSAQNAADQYLNEIKAIREEIESERQSILEQARAEAMTILFVAKEARNDCDSDAAALPEEDTQDHSDNG
ncbi:MAG: hypothetical protein IKU19_09845 [Clostridia bacterium]|nr:hypothetical protein [Clostridia bacterium]